MPIHSQLIKDINQQQVLKIISGCRIASLIFFAPKSSTLPDLLIY